MTVSIEDRAEQIRDRKRELLARMTYVDQELHHEANPDWEDSATESEQDEPLEALGLAAQQEIRMLDAALARIAEEEYGFCTKCGAQISEERLDLLPATPFCRNCAT
ncbi:MAG: TraR/DksA family transcriptional regulator [Rhodobacteraceae bacterium]|nr:MAG: TraR/DksA family transcriptional regulator [Paracoccaceae bacterium]